MCEYVSSSRGPDHGSDIQVWPGQEVDVGGLDINRFTTNEDGFWECWHPETDSWEAMYPPPPGMALRMSPGSKIRLNLTDPRPDHTKNPPPPERISAGTQMRDLIPR